jgi:hypothetical protein
LSCPITVPALLSMPSIPSNKPLANTGSSLSLFNSNS